MSSKKTSSFLVFIIFMSMMRGGGGGGGEEWHHFIMLIFFGMMGSFMMFSIYFQHTHPDKTPPEITILGGSNVIPLQQPLSGASFGR